MTNDKLTREMVLAARFMRGYQNRPRGQETILKVLSEEESLHQHDIQHYLQVSPGTVSEMISKLESKGLVERKRNAEDRRAVEISITESGREHLKSLAEENQDDVFAVLSEEEKQNLYDILVKLNNDLLRKVPLERHRRMHPDFGKHGCEGRMPHRERGRNFEGRFRFVGERHEKRDEEGETPDKKHTI